MDMIAQLFNLNTIKNSKLQEYFKIHAYVSGLKY